MLALVAALVFVVCTALLSASIQADSGQYLAVIGLGSQRELGNLASRGLNIVHSNADLLVAICSKLQISQLGQAGIQFDLLQPLGEDTSPYLIYDGAALESSCSLDTANAYPYAEDAYIAQLRVDQAEALAIAGADLVRLSRAIPWPLDVATPMRRASVLPSVSVESLAQAVSPTLLIHHVCKLQDRDALGYCNELGTRYSFASAGLNEAAAYLYSAYTSYGLQVTYDPFVFNSMPMTNVVAELMGSTGSREHVVILSAHYDSISPQPYDAAPGADDNASGVAAVLEVARLLSEQSFPCTIRFINFAGEEQGLIGSAHYAEQAYRRGDMIDGVINLDMIAYESLPPGDHLVDIHAGTDPRSVLLADELVASISSLEEAIHELPLLVPQVITAGATWRSDHGSFWARGFPAVLGSEDMDDLNPNYHSTRDTRSRIRPQLMVEFTKAALVTIARLASRSYAPTPTPTSAPTPTLTATPWRLYLNLVRPLGW